MASNDAVILVSGTETVPLSYVVPNSQEVQPLACNATFNGAAASGAFVPTLEIVSDAGVVVARVPTSTTVAAGGSAEVTFAPFLRAAAVSSGVTTTITTTGLQSETLPIWITGASILTSAGGNLYTQIFPYAFTAGTKLTGFFGGQWSNAPSSGTGHMSYGLCDTTGLVIATTGSLGTAFWNVVPRVLKGAFTGPVTLAADTQLYAWVHGFAGTWNAQPAVAAANHSNTFLQQVVPNDWFTVLGALPPASFDGSFGSTPPALGSTINLHPTFASGSSISVYMGVY